MPFMKKGKSRFLFVSKKTDDAKFHEPYYRNCSRLFSQMYFKLAKIQFFLEKKK